MSWIEIPCLSLAIERLGHRQTNHFAIWAVQAPHPGGSVHHDCVWPRSLDEEWRQWYEFFSVTPSETAIPLVLGSAQTLAMESHKLDNFPFFPSNLNVFEPKPDPKSEPQKLQLSHSSDDSLDPLETTTDSFQLPTSQSSQMMQDLGVGLWNWLFSGVIHTSLSESQGIATGCGQPLRLRLDVRDPQLAQLPWEIMQPPGKQVMALNHHNLLFSRTTSDVAPLNLRLSQAGLKVLLVLGQNARGSLSRLALEREGQAIADIVKRASQAKFMDNRIIPGVPCQVDIQVQPSPKELTTALEHQSHNLFIYAGHGMSAPDGGCLFLNPDTPPLNGIELAQVLSRCGVTLAVFNACWGARSACDHNHQPLARSSLAEVLIHHGVPAVLGMRDSIADPEALCFIETFTRALTERIPIDQAVSIARQHLLTLFKFNQPAWTLPVLYMHPQFGGNILLPIEGVTQLPDASCTWLGYQAPIAAIRAVEASEQQFWYVRGGLMRVGRRQDNDLVIEEPWVSQNHAEILCRDSLNHNSSVGETIGDLNSSLRTGSQSLTYYLRDFSRYGTLVRWPTSQSWQRIHHQEVEMAPGTRIKFGSSRGQELEFTLCEMASLPTPPFTSPRIESASFPTHSPQKAKLPYDE